MTQQNEVEKLLQETLAQLQQKAATEQQAEQPAAPTSTPTEIPGQPTNTMPNNIPFNAQVSFGSNPLNSANNNVSPANPTTTTFGTPNPAFSTEQFDFGSIKIRLKLPLSGVILELREPTVLERTKLRAEIPAYITTGIELGDTETARLFRDDATTYHGMLMIAKTVDSLCRVVEIPDDHPFKSFANEIKPSDIIFMNQDLVITYLALLALTNDFFLTDLELSCEHCGKDYTLNVIIDPSIFSSYSLDDLSAIYDESFINELKKSKSKPVTDEQVKEKLNESGKSVLASMVLEAPTHKLTPFISTKILNVPVIITPFALLARTLTLLRLNFLAWNVFNTTTEIDNVESLLEHIKVEELKKNPVDFPADIYSYVIKIGETYVTYDNAKQIAAMLPGRVEKRLKMLINQAQQAPQDIDFTCKSVYQCPHCGKVIETTFDIGTFFFQLLLA